MDDALEQVKDDEMIDAYEEEALSKTINVPDEGKATEEVLSLINWLFTSSIANLKQS